MNKSVLGAAAPIVLHQEKLVGPELNFWKDSRIFLTTVPPGRDRLVPRGVLNALAK